MEEKKNQIQVSESLFQRAFKLLRILAERLCDGFANVYVYLRQTPCKLDSDNSYETNEKKEKSKKEMMAAL